MGIGDFIAALSPLSALIRRRTTQWGLATWTPYQEVLTLKGVGELPNGDWRLEELDYGELLGFFVVGELPNGDWRQSNFNGISSIVKGSRRTTQWGLATIEENGLLDFKFHSRRTTHRGMATYALPPQVGGHVIGSENYP